MKLAHARSNHADHVAIFAVVIVGQIDTNKRLIVPRIDTDIIRTLDFYFSRGFSIFDLN
jgi:hypothetical protein